MTDLEKALQYFIIAVPENEEMSKAYFWARRALNAYTQTAEREGWISVDDHLPPENDSIFKKFKGTDKWCAGMFEAISCDVIVSMTFGDGTQKTGAARTKDGRWTGLPEVGHPVITHWMPFPNPCEDRSV